MHRIIRIMTTIKVKRKEKERKMIKIVVPNTESTSAEEKTEIPETEEKKIDHMITMREISTITSEKIEEDGRNDEIGIEVIRGEIIAKTDRKEETRGKRTMTEKEIVKRDWKGEVEGTMIGNVGIVITRGKDWTMMTIRDTETDRTGIKENDERK